MVYQKGMTLIELLLAVVVSSVLVASFFLAFEQQQRMYMRSLDRIESEQQGKAALHVLKSEFLHAGYGLPASEEAAGVFFSGACDDNGGFDETVRFCDNVVQNERASDKIRLIHMRDPVVHSFVGSDFSVVSSNPSSITVQCNQNNVPSCGAFSLNTLVAVSAFCESAVRTTELFEVVSFSQTQTSNYGLEAVDGRAECVRASGAFYVDVYMAPVSVVDFYVDRQNVADPRLMMRVFERRSAPREMVVAQGVYDLQVQYGVRVPDLLGGDHVQWCDGLFGENGGCVQGMTANQIRNNLVAVRYAVVMQGRMSHPVVENAAERDFFTRTVFNNSTVFSGEGFERWVYRGAVSLRNGVL